MAFFTKPPRYRSYLLTFWEERSRDSAYPKVWRFRLEDPDTSAQRGFGNLEELMAFLQGTLEGAEPDSSDGGMKACCAGSKDCGLNMLELRLFGTGQATCFDRPLVGFPHQQAYALLCFLLLHRGRAHPRERLAALFWGDHSELRHVNAFIGSFLEELGAGSDGSDG